MVPVPRSTMPGPLRLVPGPLRLLPGPLQRLVPGPLRLQRPLRLVLRPLRLVPPRQPLLAMWPTAPLATAPLWLVPLMRSVWVAAEPVWLAAVPGDAIATCPSRSSSTPVHVHLKPGAILLEALLRLAGQEQQAQQGHRAAAAAG